MHRAPDSADTGLVERIRAGDERAFEEMYERYAAPLLGYCIKVLRSKEDAQDALQQTFLKSHRALRANRNEILLRPWLYTIARNECISILRRRDDRQLSLNENDPPGVNPLARVEHHVEQREELRAILADVERLPAEQREALVRSSLGTMSGAEIAAILDCDPEKVKSLVYRARRSLAAGCDAREMACEEVRSQLIVLCGGSLRRKALRQHVLACEACSRFSREVRRQRQLVHDAARASRPPRDPALVGSGIAGVVEPVGRR